MAGRKYTVMIIPSHASGARRFGVARRTVWSASLCLLALVGVSFYLSYDRVRLYHNLIQLDPLRQRVEAQRELLERLGDRLREVDKSLARLRRLETQLRIMASLKPSDRRGDLGVGGVTKYDNPDQTEKLAPSEKRILGRLNRQFLDLEQRAAGRENTLKEVLQAFREKRVLLAHTPSILPIKGWLTSGFGYRKSVFTGQREFHAGIDVVARPGTPVVSPADGVVIKSRRESGYGNTVEIRHMQGIITRFAHNQKNVVKTGQRVRRGDLIAYVGTSGRSTGPHLHYEVRLNGLAVNPMHYIVEEIARR